MKCAIITLLKLQLRKHMPLYQVDFTTWENDGDFYKTLSIYLTTQEDVNFYKDLANIFVDKYNERGMGNDECDSNVIDEIVEDLIEEHKNMSESIKQEWQSLFGKENQIYNKLCDEVLSQPVEYDYGFCRVMESVEVTEILPGYWIEVGKQPAVFKELKDNKIVYAYSVYELNEDKTPNIFKLEWQTQLCGLKDFTVVQKPDEVSQQVIKLIN